MVCHQLAKFGGHRYCSSRDMFLVCHVIKTTGLKVSPHLAKFVGHRYCNCGDISFILSRDLAKPRVRWVE